MKNITYSKLGVFIFALLSLSIPTLAIVVLLCYIVIYPIIDPGDNLIGHINGNFYLFFVALLFGIIYTIPKGVKFLYKQLIHDTNQE